MATAQAVLAAINAGASSPLARRFRFHSPLLFTLVFYLALSSPPMQLMVKTGGFNPTRIPPSVFTKSSTPTEWSVTSNDSLFSIRVGDGITSEVIKPEELSEKRDDLCEAQRNTDHGRTNQRCIQKGSDAVKSEIHIQHFVKPVKMKSSCLPCHCVALEFARSSVASVRNCQVVGVSVRIGRVAAVIVQIGRAAVVSVRPGRALSVRPGRVVSVLPERALSVCPGRFVSARLGRVLSARTGRALSARLGFVANFDRWGTTNSKRSTKAYHRPKERALALRVRLQVLAVHAGRPHAAVD
ncbi:hypothetical protein PHJA_002672300 [Phtheirospermum japonicum]|uniref:Uncharacterized protein n=1 Tax=Phtheirospermum japonicum TaxID=374723 RepID=A0A830DGP9_9LAMI|nr:hypothetical protein PHJA_002672300 [Phtheirospermum japonicum]